MATIGKSPYFVSGAWVTCMQPKDRTNPFLSFLMFLLFSLSSQRSKKGHKGQVLIFSQMSCFPRYKKISLARQHNLFTRILISPVKQFHSTENCLLHLEYFCDLFKTPLWQPSSLPSNKPNLNSLAPLFA